MPSGYLISKDISFDPISHGSNAFNVLSHLNFNKQLVDEINNILSILKDSINLVCDNHLLKAINCDNNYLPFRKQSGKIVLLTFLPLSNDDRRILISIGDKIIPNMNTQKVNFTINNEQTDPVIIHSMVNDTVTNILLKFLSMTSQKKTQKIITKPRNTKKKRSTKLSSHSDK